MDQRRCCFCQGHFDPSRFHPEQTVCSAKVCQQRRRAESRKHKLATDPECRQVCRDSARKWRADHPGYWKKYRTDKPEAAERNRIRQQHRDQRQRLLDPANNNVALDLRAVVAGVWLLGPAGEDLANNNLASAQVFIVPSLRRKPPASTPSCKQHPSGLSAAGA
jgi:hypothetical protein